jgi:hypothetical protein
VFGYDLGNGFLMRLYHDSFGFRHGMEFWKALILEVLQRISLAFE